jgi:hypothetical protein
MKTLRWILIPIACFAAWHLAVIVGIFILSTAELFCPRDHISTDMCMAPWWQFVETGIFCFSTGLSAVLVVMAGFFIAPAARVQVAWLIYGVGSIIALYMAAMTSAWYMFASAIVAGVLTTFLLTRSRFSQVVQK